MLEDEVVWQKSSYSEHDYKGRCVWMAKLHDGSISVKNDNGTSLNFTVEEIKAFLSGVKSGEFDNLIT